MTVRVKAIKSSVDYATGKFIHSFQLYFPRMVLAELNTHRMLAKSTSSSRAIPIEKIIERVKSDPAIPLWTENQPGMQGTPACDYHIERANAAWEKARDDAIYHAKVLMDLGIHKQDANRLLETWVHVDTIITGTEWDNFFKLRCHKDAAPLMQMLGNAIRDAMGPAPTEIKYTSGWHLPYATEEEINAAKSNATIRECLPWVCAARCARVSYLNHDGTAPDIDKDMVLAKKLHTSGHLTPFEHVAYCDPVNMVGDEMLIKNTQSCIRGTWITLRYLIETDKISFPQI